MLTLEITLLLCACKTGNKRKRFGLFMIFKSRGLLACSIKYFPNRDQTHPQSVSRYLHQLQFRRVPQKNLSKYLTKSKLKMLNKFDLLMMNCALQQLISIIRSFLSKLLRIAILLRNTLPHTSSLGCHDAI